MTIDPILPLSISIAEGKGTYAFFLGSGISSMAGVPTGTKLLELTKEKLYMMDKTLKTIDNAENFQKWLELKDINDIDYSKLLEMFPSEEDRRIFLEQFFSDVKPTESHVTVAKMVEKGLIKVIITTNFDRLMESALDDRKIDYDVVDCSHDLKTLKPREHAKCRILKLHGDYKRLNIKNTEKELEKLEPGIKEEFQTILNNYGIVVAGYRGSDKGVMSCFRERESKYTLYWLKHNNLVEDVEGLVKKQNGRIIRINSSDKFFLELSNKIDYYSTYENVETPQYLTYMAKEYIRTKDRVNFNETLKKQMKSLENEWFKIYNNLEKGFDYGNKELIVDTFKDFEKYMDTITAIGLVLIEYPHEFINLFFKYIQRIYDLSSIIFEDKMHHIGRSALVDIPKGAINNMFYIMGAFCLKEDNLSPLTTLFTKELYIREYGSMTSQFIWNTDIIYPLTFDESPEKIFKFLIESYDYKDYLKDFFRSKTEFTTYLCQFNLILCLYISKMINNFPERDYGFNPNFSAYRGLKGEITIPILKCASNFEYLKEMSNVFQETTSQFKNNFNNRCESVNKVTRNNYGLRGFKVPLAIFGDE